ncbi:MAG: 5-methylcytosine-specific restriction endonuclease system specificity protein McrC [Caldilineaceae bacterium SB0662_bin_9]|uniref:5-methylcytosine-specific restriction endonuclease system specificity protein McrC n=1 Tax=Caldilineaceae bacterium SB0662_bin_9 TaxID=2605258 RepID=A0A6B1DTJ0_9CHLR|nr:5-methylcytosine-specific restriction endonuclease system specificity protein McrC [Caldilineaceae bacterium SB0662_bin_9]
MGYIGRIPIRNIWLLMFYASDLYRHRGDQNGAVETNPDPLADLVAEILAHRVELRFRRQLSTGFQSREADLRRVKGRIDLLRTTRHRLLDQGLIACRFDTLSLDTPANRLVLAALETMANTVDDRNLASRCGSLALRLRRAGVSGQTPTRRQITSIADGRLVRDDEKMIATARLALDLALPTELEGKHSLPIPSREERWARDLFERAVAGFYDVVARPYGWTVSAGRWLRWNEQAPSPGIKDILPSMKTDIILEHQDHGHRIVIDTKFTEIVTAGWHRESSLKSDYIYQMYAYLRSQEGLGDRLADSASGLLLHPTIGSDVDESAKFQGHRIRFATVDLAASAMDIRSRLLQVIQVPDAKTGPVMVR